MRITTKRGDDGFTSLIGERVSKADPRLDVIGSLDECLALIGIALQHIESAAIRERLEALEERIQKFMGELAGGEEVAESFLNYLDKITREDLPIKGFVKPRGAAAYIHLVRARVRSAERAAVKAGLKPVHVKVLNRLSDALFILAYKCAEGQGLEFY